MDAENIIAGLRTRLLNRRGSYVSVAGKSGLSVSWLSKFATGKKNDPKLKTLVALENALSMAESADAERTWSKDQHEPAPVDHDEAA